MTKLEKQQAIIDKLKALVKYNNELDKNRREMVKREIENGSDPDTWKDIFYFNGYIYITELVDIISVVMFDHSSQTIERYPRYFKGIPRRNNYVDILTEDETEKINKIIGGMIKANVIQMSKSGKMVKLLEEV